MPSVPSHNLNKLQTYSLPSGSYTSLTLGSYGTYYTAPADGWYFLAKNTSGTQYFDIGVYDNVNTDYLFVLSNRLDGTIRLLIPVKKGYKIKVAYNASGALEYFRFIYALGSEPQT